MTRALGWMTSRLPLGICRTTLESPGMASTSLEPRSSERTDSEGQEAKDWDWEARRLRKREGGK